ncbi:Uncharacterised protein [Enterobacter hormaechei]|nr:Uncharacterised protein [Enterobacter hormaechei]SAD61461.1 Uncharacterised protein [Enterobacter hormaechei]
MPTHEVLLTAPCVSLHLTGCTRCLFLQFILHALNCYRKQIDISHFAMNYFSYPHASATQSLLSFSLMCGKHLHTLRQHFSQESVGRWCFVQQISQRIKFRRLDDIFQFVTVNLTHLLMFCLLR